MSALRMYVYKQCGRSRTPAVIVSIDALDNGATTYLICIPLIQILL